LLETTLKQKKPRIKYIRDRIEKREGSLDEGKQEYSERKMLG
jgi:hypothetical protein